MLFDGIFSSEIKPHLILHLAIVYMEYPILPLLKQIGTFI